MTTSTTTRTSGELLFEQYLSRHGMPFQFEQRRPGKSKKPDYSIILAGQEFLFDVKDFAAREFPQHGGFYDPIGPIRYKIDEAQYKFQEYKAYPCGLVLHNEGAPLIHLSDPLLVFGAMFGDPGFSVPIDINNGRPAGPTRAAFLDGGKMIHSRGRKPRIDHISALLTIRNVKVGHMRMQQYVETLPKKSAQTPAERAIALLEHIESVELPFDPNEQEVGMIVWENIFAVQQLSSDLFCGQFDERWTFGSSGPHLAYRGPELNKLKGSST